MAPTATLLLTRPRDAALRFADMVQRQLGPMPVVIAPLLDIRFLDVELPAADHLLFTSRNGVTAWMRAGGRSDLPCTCVGDATGQAAREAGFDPAISGGTVEHLLADMRRAAPAGKLLHIRGAHARGALADQLRASGLSASECVAYAQDLLDLPQDSRELVEGGAPVILPLFSPRSAAQFEAQGLAPRNTDIIAISDAAAAVCPAARVATFPSAEGMIEAIANSPVRRA